MNQYISSHSRPRKFFFSIHFDFLRSQFTSLDPSYSFPLLSVKPSSIFLTILLILHADTCPYQLKRFSFIFSSIIAALNTFLSLRFELIHQGMSTNPLRHSHFCYSLLIPWPFQKGPHSDSYSIVELVYWPFDKICPLI